MVEKFIICPICNRKTRIKIREATKATNLPVFCPKCKKTFVIDIKPGFDVIKHMY